MLKLVPVVTDADKSDAEKKDASWKKEYNSRLCSAEQAVSFIQTGSYKNNGRPA